MSDKVGNSPHRKISPVYWVLLGVVALAVLAILLPTRSGPSIDKALRSDIEMSQIHTALMSYEGTFGGFPSG
jgi:hypothetical protein